MMKVLNVQLHLLDLQKIIDNDVMIAWDCNCSLDKGIIGSAYNFETIVAEDIKDLIDDGLIEVLEDV